MILALMVFMWFLYSLRMNSYFDSNFSNRSRLSPYFFKEMRMSSSVASSFTPPLRKLIPLPFLLIMLFFIFYNNLRWLRKYKGSLVVALQLVAVVVVSL